jgi:hypothetical protein
MFALVNRKTLGVLVALIAGLLFCGGTQNMAQAIEASGNVAGESTTSEFKFLGTDVVVGTDQDPVEMSHDGLAGPWFKKLCFVDAPPESNVVYYISQSIQVAGSDLWKGWYEVILTEHWRLADDKSQISFLVDGKKPPHLFMIPISSEPGVYFGGFEPISPEQGTLINITLPVVWNGPTGDLPGECVETMAFPFGQPAGPTTISVDIKPGRCPNRFMARGWGVLRAAIHGSAEFDVGEIDPASIRLEGVAPLWSRMKDVSTPVEDRTDFCDCNRERQDGFDDLVFFFRGKEIIKALGEVCHDDELVLTLTGKLMNGKEIEGEDCVVILKRLPPAFEKIEQLIGRANSPPFYWAHPNP